MRQPLQMVRQIVAEPAHGPGLERHRQGRIVVQPVVRQRPLQHRERIAGEAPLAERDAAVLAGQPQIRVGRDVAPPPQPRVGPRTVQQHRPPQAANRLERGQWLEPGDLTGEDGGGQGRRSQR